MLPIEERSKGFTWGVGLWPSVITHVGDKVSTEDLITFEIEIQDAYNLPATHCLGQTQFLIA
jgi:hypothetical protein